MLTTIQHTGQQSANTGSVTLRCMMRDRTWRRGATETLEAYSGALGGETCRQRGVAGVVKQFTADAVALLAGPGYSFLFITDQGAGMLAKELIGSLGVASMSPPYSVPPAQRRGGGRASYGPVPSGLIEISVGATCPAYTLIAVLDRLERSNWIGTFGWVETLQFDTKSVTTELNKTNHAMRGPTCGSGCATSGSSWTATSPRSGGAGRPDETHVESAWN